MMRQASSSTVLADTPRATASYSPNHLSLLVEMELNTMLATVSPSLNLLVKQK